MAGKFRLRKVLVTLAAALTLVTPMALTACSAEGSGSSTGEGGNAGPFKNLHDTYCTKDDKNPDRSELIKQAKVIAKDLNKAKFGNGQWASLEDLWTKESGWYPMACNINRFDKPPQPDACGIPQALPCSKITDRTTRGQITWGLNYIKVRYGNPSNALAFWGCTTHTYSKRTKKWTRVRDYCQSAGGERAKVRDKKYTWY